MPKRKTQKTNNQSSPEIVTPQKPAILRIVKLHTTDTSANSPTPSELSTAIAEENNPFKPELQVDNSQKESIEILKEHSTPVLTSHAALQTIISDNEQSELPEIVETVLDDVEELTTNIETVSDALAETEPEKELKQSGKHLSYKQLETATNSQGLTFSVGEKIEVFTCHFSTQQAVIMFLYSAPDGSIWSSYSPLTQEQKQQWRRGCCRIEYLKKLSENINNS
jgi:hypothetical protein